MANDRFIADGARNQRGKGSAFERRASSAAKSTGARRRSSPAGKRVRSLGASSLSLPRESVPAQSTRRNSRDHDAGHFEASPANRGTSPQICEKQWSDHRGNRNRRGYLRQSTPGQGRRISGQLSATPSALGRDLRHQSRAVSSPRATLSHRHHESWSSLSAASLRCRTRQLAPGQHALRLARPRSRRAQRHGGRA